MAREIKEDKVPSVGQNVSRINIEREAESDNQNEKENQAPEENRGLRGDEFLEPQDG
jgi:hypothetical protein